MTSFTFLQGAATCVVLLGLRYIVYNAYLSPLARIPNAHWSSALSSLWILWTRWCGRENRNVHDAHTRLGPVVRLGPNEVSVNCVDGGLKTVYSGNFVKGDWYSLFKTYGIDNTFSTKEAGYHGARKKMVSSVYSKSYIGSSPVAKAQARLLLQRLLNRIRVERSPESGVEVFGLWSAITMDFITAYLWGARIGTNFVEDQAERDHWLHLNRTRFKYAFFSQELPGFTSATSKIGMRLVPKWASQYTAWLEQWSLERCTQVEKLLASQEKEGGRLEAERPEDVPLVYKQIKAQVAKEMEKTSSILMPELSTQKELYVAAEALDHLYAGHETTGITLTFMSHKLSLDRKLQDSLRSELLTLDPPLKIDPTQPLISITHLPSHRDVDSLPLLNAIFMETLRICPPLPGAQPRLTPMEGCTLGPPSQCYPNIPGNVRVSAQAYSLHRDPRVFPDPEEFKPSRWLFEREGPDSPGNKAKREMERLFWAFSSGGRMCVGSNFAIHELKLIIAAVYTNYSTTIVNDDGIEQKDGYTCGPRSERLYLRFHPV